MYSCEIISVGTELLLGDILDTNARFLSRRLADMGIAVLRRSTVGDNAERLALALRSALAQSDIVILTGGLGPTADDITKEVCCEEMGFSLREDEGILNDITDYFKRRDLQMPETNKKQALVPEGGRFFRNFNGTAPGIALEKDGKCVILLPGPPREMEPMFLSDAMTLLEKYSDGVIASHTVRTMCIGESAMAERVREFLDSANPTVAPYAKDGEAMLRITAKAKSFDEAQALCLPVLEKITSRLGGHVYGIDIDSIEQQAVALLKKSGKKVALAESCTGGLIAKRITDIPGASEVFECGIVSYSNSVKAALLGVSEETLRRFGAVSEQTASEMARGVRRVACADLGLSVTGVAGPGSDGKKPAGLCFIALSDGENTWVQKLETGRSNDRDYNRTASASRALDLVRRCLCGLL